MVRKLCDLTIVKKKRVKGREKRGLGGEEGRRKRKRREDRRLMRRRWRKMFQSAKLKARTSLFTEMWQFFFLI